MAAKNLNSSNITVSENVAEPQKEIRVRIMIPKREMDDNPGVTVDQYEHVSISNEEGDFFVRVKRGEWTDVTVPVFQLLKQRYPNL